MLYYARLNGRNKFLIGLLVFYIGLGLGSGLASLWPSLANNRLVSKIASKNPAYIYDVLAGFLLVD